MGVGRGWSGNSLPQTAGKYHATKFHCCHGFGKIALLDFPEKGFLKSDFWFGQRTRYSNSNNLGNYALEEVREGLVISDQLNSS